MEVLEGIVLKKTVFKEKDLIVNLLLRSGVKISVLVYGGQGGSRKQKSSHLELGFLVRIEIQKNNKGVVSNLVVAKNVEAIWMHKKIRTHYDLYLLICFQLEVVQKLALDSEGDTGFDHHQHGLFNALSNSLFHIDKKLEFNDKLDREKELNMFLNKLLFHLGLFPDTSKCFLCHNALLVGGTYLNLEGGFMCSECASSADGYRARSDDSELLIILRTAMKLKFEQFEQLPALARTQNHQLFHYLCYHYQIQPSDFVTYSMLS